jgi:HD-GYP domain-containing protein (c-di-GMP phosphodiesterase class II)
MCVYRSESLQQPLAEAAKAISRKCLDILARNPGKIAAMAEVPYTDYLSDLTQDLQTSAFSRLLFEAERLYGQPAHALDSERLEALRIAFAEDVERAAIVNGWPSGVGAHSKRVARNAVAIGSLLDFSEDRLHEIHWGGVLHDVGKLFVNGFAMTKEAVELPRDMLMPFLRTHASLGGMLLESIYPLFQTGVIFAYQHQENVNGTGYPNGLRYEEMSIEAQIAAIADGYDAAVTRRGLGEQQVCGHYRKRYSDAGHPNDTVLLAFLDVVKRFHSKWYGMAQA